MTEYKYTYREEGCSRCRFEGVEVIEFHPSYVLEREKHQVDENGITHLCMFCYETNLSRAESINELAIQIVHAMHILLRSMKE